MGAATPSRLLPRRFPPAWTITAAFAVVYLIIAPASPDLAAASYRSNLFSRVGFTLWDNSWYGGHHLLAYSVLAPALGALIGTRLLAAISMVVATALFALLIDGCFPAAGDAARRRVVRDRRVDRAALQPRAVRPRPGDRPRRAGARAPTARCGSRWC